MKISGHKTRTVFERYNIVSPDDLREAARKQEVFLQAAQAERPDRYSFGDNQGKKEPSEGKSGG